MSYDELIVLFSQFGLAVFVGVLIGIEREMREGGGKTLGIRDFIFFAVIGALSAYLAQRFDAIWIIALSFVGLGQPQTRPGYYHRAGRIYRVFSRCADYVRCPGAGDRTCYPDPGRTVPQSCHQ